MTNRHFVIAIVSVLVVLTTFGTVFNGVLSAGYTKVAEPFFTSLLKGDFTGARQSLYLPTGAAPSVVADEKMNSLRQALGFGAGETVEVRFDRSEKVVSTDASEATPEGTTRVFFDLVAKERYVEVETLINDQAQKFQYVNLTVPPRQAPGLMLFSIVALLALTVPALYIVALVRVRSAFDHGRWWRYLTVLAFNLPTVTFLATGDIHVNLVQNQMMLGYAINLAGLSHIAVTIGLPVGAVYWIVRLKGRPQGTTVV